MSEEVKNAQASGREEFRDLGFGTKLPARQTRLINQDGSFNVDRRGLPWHRSLSVYHTLVNTSWPRFFLIVLAAYLIVNCLFSVLYETIGLEHLLGHEGNSALENFLGAFFFSAQTLTTVGYGHVSPEGFAANMAAAIESLAGLMGFALGTGLVYGRFSLPRSRLLFSRQALVAPYRGGRALMFRVANGRKNQLIEAEVEVSLSLEGPDQARRFHELSLERRQIHFFPLSWTVVHPIGPDSPLRDFDAEAFKNTTGEILVLMKAFDDSFSQVVYSRHSFRFQDVVYGGKFTYIFGRSDEGMITIDLDRLGEHEKVELSNPETMLPA